MREAARMPSCTIAIKAIPNAPPVEGRANDVLCEFLADHFSLPRRAVTVLRGDTSRQKLLRLDGLTLAELKARVAP